MEAQAIGACAAALDLPWAPRQPAWSRLKSVWRGIISRRAEVHGATESPLAEATPASTSEAREVDDAVLRRARRGDHGAFHEIVDHYEERLRVLAYHLLRDAEQMNDVLQDTFVKAYAGLPGFRSEAALGTWLHRICYNLCLDQLRRMQVRPAGEPLDEDFADPTDETERLALHAEIATALGSLPAEQRAVLLLVDREGYDYASVAEVFGVPVGTVASRLSTARSAMRQALRPDGADTEVAG
jgi:RNA polymerase sigma-70 factor (ECF subfamily)